MISLVADVGGTHTRLALAGPEFGITAMRRFRNGDFGDFRDLLQAYRSEEPLPDLTGACFAIAGPVAGGRAQLTNGTWVFDAAALGDALSAPVRLVNDLVALGHALQDLSSDQMHVIRPVSPPTQNDRALVVGIGTGFNICQVLQDPGGARVLAAELGHASLPGNLRRELETEIGRAARVFRTNEDLFSGPGLGRLHQVATDGSGIDPAALIAAAAQEPEGQAARTVDLAGRLLGLMTRELVLLYLPRAGIHFAGSAGRGLLGSPGRKAFLDAFDQTAPFPSLSAAIPLGLITDDAAGLAGAARVAVSS